MLFYGGPLLLAAWCVGAVGKDIWPLTRACYYIPPHLAVAAGGAWLIWGRRAAPLVLRVAMGAAAAAALAKIVLVDFAWHGPAVAPSATLRIVHWNTASGRYFPERIWTTLAADRPDICLLSEAPRPWLMKGRPLIVFPDPYLHVESRMALLSRFPLSDATPVDVPHGRAWSIRVETPQRRLDLLAVDLLSNPLLDRSGPLAAVARWVERHDPDIPLIVLGDFNTPRDSLHFRPLREHLAHAYELAGFGWPYTWPVPLPVWAIDHAWVSPRVRVVACELRTSPCSDHRRQIIDFSLAPPGSVP